MLVAAPAAAPAGFQPQCKSAVALVNERRIEFVRAKKVRAVVTVATDGAEDAAADKAKSKDKSGKVLVASEQVERVLSWQHSRKIGPGFANLGNTCYLNSVLQCLSYTPCFAQFLLDKDTLAAFGAHIGGSAASHMNSHKSPFGKKGMTTGGGGGGFCAVRTMARLLQSVHGGAHRVLQPKEVVMNIRHLSKSFRIGRQEDSHEFFRLLLDSMQRSCLRRANIKQETHPAAPTTFVNRMFRGRLRNSLKCAKCQFVSERFDDFLDLSLEINNGIKSLKGALKHFTATETLDDRNAWKCTSCRQLNRAEKGMTIEACPNVLVVQLKRFDMMFGKIKKHIEFPVSLDISSGMSKGSDDRRRGRCKYELHGVLVHAGFSTDCGHYYAFAKGSSGQWYEMNDDTVRWVSLDTVLQQKAYMLFYSRVLPPSERPKPEPKPAPTSRAEEEVTESVVVERKAAAAVAPKAPVLAKTKELDMNGFLSSLKTSVDAESSSSATRSSSAEVVVETVQVTAKLPSAKRLVRPAFAGHIGKLHKFRRSVWQPCSSLAMTRRSVTATQPAEVAPPATQEPATSNGVKDTLVSTASVKVPFDPRKLKNVGVQNAALFGREVDKWSGETDAESSETAGSDGALERELAAKHDHVLKSLKQEDWKRRNAARLDYWDETLDTGKVKKVKKRKEFVPNQGRQNQFQTALMHKKKKLQRTS